MPVPLHDITSYLDQYLRVADVGDSAEALNGLQVDGMRDVTTIASAVDACLATIDGAVAQGAELLLVHHGLFWAGLEPLTGRHGKRVRRLMETGVGLYSAHIPLDLHPEVGNNAVLAEMLSLDGRHWFGDYKGEALGVAGTLSIDLRELQTAVGLLLGVQPQVLAFGPETTSSVGIISGGGGDMLAQARDAGVDTFITGEGKHHHYFDAEEWGMNVIFVGHYATETVGIKALTRHVAQKFDLPWEFIDHPTGM